MTKEYKRFHEALEKVLSVTHAEIKKREADDKASREVVPRRRRGKTKPAVSGSDRAEDKKD